MSKLSVCVIGLGYVGMPTACILANSGYNVVGVDNNQDIISNIDSLSSLNIEPDLYNLFQNAVTSNYIKFSKNPEHTDIFIITVPTPLNQSQEPDISYVESAIDSIIPYIKPNNLILIESTCPIGTTERISIKLKSLLNDIYVAYCPERIMTGNIINELKNNNRVVGGVDKESTLKAYEFYKSFTEAKISTTDSKTAEAIKLAENAYRDINIAYANELSMICQKLGIDVRELVKLANEHPRVNILQPGIGVGGHCIPVDPYFLIYAAPKEATLIKTSRTVNSTKTNWVIKYIQNTAKRYNIKTIACLGLSYKPDTPDIRNSPAIKIATSLKKKFKILEVDPYISNSCSLVESIEEAEMIVKLVAHKEFINTSSMISKNKIFIDFTSK